MAIHAQSEITLNTIPAYTSLLGGHFVYYQGDSSGTVASANVVQNPTSSPSNWGYNTHIGANGIQLRDGTVAYTVLNQDGLTVSKGGIQGGAIGEQDGIYLSTLGWPIRQLLRTTDTSIDPEKTYYQLSNEEYEVVIEPDISRIRSYYELVSETEGISINNHIPTIARSGSTIDSQDPAWKQIIGSKFGIDADGNIYASGGKIGGTNGFITIKDGIVSIGNTNVNFDIVQNSINTDTIEEILGANDWINSNGSFIRTEDEVVNLSKQYYAAGGDYILTRDDTVKENKNYYTREESYELTADEEIVQGKTYYTRSGEEGAYVYTEVLVPQESELRHYYEKTIYYLIVTNPDSSHINEYYEIGEYILTSDTEIDNTKIYYYRTGEGTVENPFVYTEVLNPIVSELEVYYEFKITTYTAVVLTEYDNPYGYYEMIDLKTNITNFVNTHFVVTKDGLTITKNDGYNLLLDNNGISLTGPQGLITRFGENIEFSTERPQRIGGTRSYIEFLPYTYVLTRDRDIEINKVYYNKIDYILTSDPDIIQGKQYYVQSEIRTYYTRTEKVDYVLTSDTTVQSGKEYYIRTGAGSREDPFDYTLVETPHDYEINTYYERYAYYIYEPVLEPDPEEIEDYFGPAIRYVYNEVENPDVEYKDTYYEHLTTPQYIEVTNPDILLLRDYYERTQQLNIIADNIRLSGIDALERIGTFEELVPQLEQDIYDQHVIITGQTEQLDKMLGFIDIDNAEDKAIIRVGNIDSGEAGINNTSYVEINGGGGENKSLKGDINMKGKEVAYRN